jgi:hypothetical protein
MVIYGQVIMPSPETKYASPLVLDFSELRETNVIYEPPCLQYFVRAAQID